MRDARRRSLLLVLLALPPAAASVSVELDEERRETFAHKQLISGVCDACESVWIKSTFKAGSNMMVNPAASIEWHGDLPDQCFASVERACADCKSTSSGCAYNPSHVKSDSPLSLVSVSFEFCRGHTAISAAEMSFVAWTRVIEWKLDACKIPPVQPVHSKPASRPEWWWRFTRHAEYERQQQRASEGPAHESRTSLTHGEL